MIALVDCNSFYASCEHVFRPDLKDSPIVVLSNNDGCVVAMDRAARTLGVHRGMPLFEAKADIATAGAHVFSSNYTLYQDLSDRVMEILADHGYVLEKYSIDEAFLHIPSHREETLIELGRSITDEVHRCTGIPVSVGFARTKTLAKIANRWAKTHCRDAGFFIMDEYRETSILESVNVMDIWGIGPRKAAFLLARGITNAQRLREMPDDWVKKHLSLVTLRTVWELRGVPSVADEMPDQRKKTILSSLGFGTPITDLRGLEEAVVHYTEIAVGKLVAQGSEASEISVFITTNRFQEGLYRNAATIRLPLPTAYLPELTSAALTILRAIYRDGLVYAKAGVMLSLLDTDESLQGQLFTTTDRADDLRERQRTITQAVREINSQYGRQTIRCHMGVADASGWYMRRDRLSPRYTTRWDELPKVT